MIASFVSSYCLRSHFVISLLSCRSLKIMMMIIIIIIIIIKIVILVAFTVPYKVTQMRC